MAALSLHRFFFFNLMIGHCENRNGLRKKKKEKDALGFYGRPLGYGYVKRRLRVSRLSMEMPTLESFVLMHAHMNC